MFCDLYSYVFLPFSQSFSSTAGSHCETTEQQVSAICPRILNWRCHVTFCHGYQADMHSFPSLAACPNSTYFPSSNLFCLAQSSWTLELTESPAQQYHRLYHFFNIHSSHKVTTQPVILCIELGGKPKRLSIEFEDPHMTHCARCQHSNYADSDCKFRQSAVYFQNTLLVPITQRLLWSFIIIKTRFVFLLFCKTLQGNQIWISKNFRHSDRQQALSALYLLFVPSLPV